MTNPENQHLQGGEQQEQEPSTTPRIYVASLADYNDGNLHGEWIEANQNAEDLHAQTNAMLARSATPHAEEWAIHDYEGFGPFHVGDFQDFALVGRIAAGIENHGIAFAHWASVSDMENEADQNFEDSYLGEWKSVDDYAEHVLDDLGYLDELAKIVPQHLQPYISIDTSAFGRDLLLSGDVWQTKSDEGGVHLFATNV